jgi:GNAT superfamily N-acetyltransferase
MALSIRKAQARDITALCELMQELSGHPITPAEMRERLRFIKTSPSDSLWVCGENGKILGAMGFRIRENLETTTRYGEVSVLVVYPHSRNKGVGRFMMQHAEKLARDYGCIGTWLVSGFGREESAHEFCKLLGYHANGYRFIRLFD